MQIYKKKKEEKIKSHRYAFNRTRLWNNCNKYKEILGFNINFFISKKKRLIIAYVAA